MPRLIEQANCTGSVTAGWVGTPIVGVPSRCKLTTLRIVYSGIHASTSVVWVSLGEDTANKYDLLGVQKINDEDTNLHAPTIGCFVINLDMDYVANKMVDNTLYIWNKRSGGSDCTFTAYLHFER